MAWNSRVATGDKDVLISFPQTWLCRMEQTNREWRSLHVSVDLRTAYRPIFGLGNKSGIGTHLHSSDVFGHDIASKSCLSENKELEIRRIFGSQQNFPTTHQSVKSFCCCSHFYPVQSELNRTEPIWTELICNVLMMALTIVVRRGRPFRLSVPGFLFFPDRCKLRVVAVYWLNGIHNIQFFILFLSYFLMAFCDFLH